LAAELWIEEMQKVQLKLQKQEGEENKEEKIQ
jgi:hypothetical protein